MSAAPDLSSAVLLSLAEIRLDGGTQSRAQLSDDTIADYSEKYTDGVAMPPAVVFYDGSSYWLADGFHRCAGAKKAGKASVVVEVRQGSQRDAILFSVGANDSHGLRRTNADKRRAVEMLLRDEEWRGKGDNWIAKQCGVAQSFVWKLGKELISEIGSRPEREGQDGKVRKMPERAPAAERLTPETVFVGEAGTSGVISKMEARATELTAAAPDPKIWWVCQISSCGKEFNRAAASKRGWVARGYCGDCEEAEPVPDEQETEEPASVPPAAERPRMGELLGIVQIELLEKLSAQRNADPDFASLRQTQKAISQALPSRAQRMLEFILDGGELSLLRLGVDWTVTPEALQQAYRDKSRTAHPDRGGSQERFVALTRDREMVKTMLGGAE